MSYKKVECEQGSTEWLALRKTKITATDTGVILGLNPWKTPLMLWEEKLGLREPQAENEKMREGKRLEVEALDFLNSTSETQDEHFLPEVLISTKYPFMMASLDAMNDLQEIVEIKCGKGSHELAKQGIIPDYYVSQCQKQMFVSGCEKMTYVSFRGKDDSVSIVVERDDSFIEKMIEAETEFYRCLMELTPPPATNRDFIIKETKDWHLHAEVWKDTKRQIKLLEAKEEALRDELIEMCEGQSSQGSGIKISKSIRRGNIDYSAIEELNEIDLEKYRKKPTIFWRISESA